MFDLSHRTLSVLAYVLPRAMVLGTLFMLLASAGVSQTRTPPRARARGIPAPAVSSFAATAPVIAPVSHGPAKFPADHTQPATAHVFHGGKPGPVVAYLFHGFSNDEAFHSEMESIFGDIDLSQFQGSILALSFPQRLLCEEAKPCPTVAVTQWNQLAPNVLDSTRFVVDVHQSTSGAAAGTYAFVYLPHENARLATYVKAMARAALAPHIVELNESTLDAMGSSAVALEHLAPQSLALSHPAIALETPPLEKNQSAAAEQTRKGLINLLRHLKMSSGAVSWQNGAKRHTVESLPAGFFQSGADPVQE